jgi:chloramphenicol-sensitive protein RarD
MNNKKHYAAAITAFFIWGFFAIPLRALHEYSAGDILYFRILFSLVTLIIIIFGFKRGDLKSEWLKFRSLPLSDRNKVMTLTLAGGLLLCINWLCFIYIVTNINVKTASFTYLLCPVLTAILAFALLKEQMSRIQWIAVGLCSVSCVLIGMNSAYELGYSFLTAFTYALYLISQRKNQGFDRMMTLGIQVLFSFIVLTLFSGYLVTAMPLTFKFYYIIVIIAVVFTVFPLFLNLYALNRINSATIGILMYLNPLFNFAVAFLIFGETINAIQLLGYGIIVIALVLFNYQNFRKIQTAMGSVK